MIADIQWAFSTLVRSADWMDEDSKVAAMDKAATVKQFIGFPEWLLDKDRLEEYYAGVSKLRQLKSQTFGLFWSSVFQNHTVRFEDRIGACLQAFLWLDSTGGPRPAHGCSFKNTLRHITTSRSLWTRDRPVAETSL
jgi:hypothetical protein